MILRTSSYISLLIPLDYSLVSLIKVRSPGLGLKSVSSVLILSLLLSVSISLALYSIIIALSVEHNYSSVLQSYVSKLNSGSTKPVCPVVRGDVYSSVLSISRISSITRPCDPVGIPQILGSCRYIGRLIGPSGYELSTRSGGYSPSSI